MSQVDYLFTALAVLSSLATGISAGVFLCVRFPRLIANGKEQMAEPVPPPAPRLIPNGWATVLTDKRFAEIWQGVEERNDLYLAVQQLLARETLEAIDYASRPELADKPGTLAAANGNVWALINLAGALQTAREHPENWTTQSTQKPRRL